MNQQQTLQIRLEKVKSSIDKAHHRYEPNLKLPELIAVSKTFSSEEISPLLDLGHRVFGENRVQEAYGKWPRLKEEYVDVELHLIGPLQTNKVDDAVALFEVIQTLDREKLAVALARAMKKSGKIISLFVQVNIGSESQKSGVAPEEVVRFVKKCRDEFGLEVVGLMCIPPFEDAPGPYFAWMKDLAEEANVKYLSMGMSSDFETAIEMGATHVRVGTAIFGQR